MQSSTSKPSFSQARDALFLAGASRTSLFFIVPAALFSALDATMRWGMFSWLAFFAQLAVLWHGLSLLGRFSQGVLDVETEIGDELASFEIMTRVVVVWTGFAVLSWALRYESRNLSVAFDVACAVLKPAILILLAMGSPLANALRIDRVWFVISTIGARYLWLCLGLLLISLGTGSLADMRNNATTLFFVSFCLEMLAFYGVLVSFAMMGYCMYVNADELGLYTLASRAEQVRTAMHHPEPLEDDPDKLLAAGRTEEALALLYEAARLAPDNVPHQQNYYEAIMRYGAVDAPGKAKQLVQAGRLLRAYAKAERSADVARVMEQWWPALQADVLGHTALSLQVAALSVQGGSPERALELFCAFERMNKGAMDMPQVLLAHAELLIKLKRGDQALPLAQEIVALYSHSDETPRAREILLLSPATL
jgi:tetratricopeptide (TPR) repeat protein